MNLSAPLIPSLACVYNKVEPKLIEPDVAFVNMAMSISC